MKDNKYAPYILGPLVLVVWGLIFYKIYQAVYGGESNYAVPNFGALPVYETAPQDSGYALLVDYVDPFLGKRVGGGAPPPARRVAPRASSASSSPMAQRTAPAPKSPVATPFPAIVYQGYQVMEGDTIALLKVNGRFYPVARLGDVYQGVGIQAIYGDSIRLSFQEQEQVFSK